MSSCKLAEMALYRLTVVPSATSVWSLEDQIMGHAAYVIMYPVRDFAVEGSTSALTLSQLPTKSASTQHSKECSLGFSIKPLSLVASKYFPILFTAEACDSLGSAENCAHWCTE